MTHRSSTPRILLYDLETSHNLVASFDIWTKHGIPHQNIVKERFIICAAWKWLDEPRIYTAEIAKPGADGRVLGQLRAAIEQADCLVAHYGSAFDQKYVVARSLIHGLPPLPPIPLIDTKQVAARIGYFNCNRLDYLAGVLKVGRKSKTDSEWWLDIVLERPGWQKSLAQMVKYNRVDVQILEGVFKKLQPYIPDHINRQLFGSGDMSCPRCGALALTKQGLRRSITRVYQRYRCTKCGGWARDVKNVSELSAKQRVL